jgi:indolepyruvate ferredoxin oxidoreductase
MNMMTALTNTTSPTSSVTLDDKYLAVSGRALMSGTQALVRLTLMQRARDVALGLNTAGFVTGYRGSPLGGVDFAMWAAKKILDQNEVTFQASINEDLAATAVFGTQQLGFEADAKKQGVYALWYGKGPGVDRSGDALKHGNFAGSSAYGGVLIVAGDDHASKSSTLPHQSDHALKASLIPVLYPSNVQEIIDYGLHGWAMSRFSGCWIGLKCVTDVVETSAVVDVSQSRIESQLPNIDMPRDGVSIRSPDAPLAQEARMFNTKLPAVLAYVRSNNINQHLQSPPRKNIGLISAGKAFNDVMAAIKLLGIDSTDSEAIGLHILKIGMVWPLDNNICRQFADGLNEVLVVEEKQELLESQFITSIYGVTLSTRCRVYGQLNCHDMSLTAEQREISFSPLAEHNPVDIANVLAKFIVRNVGENACIRAKVDRWFQLQTERYQFMQSIVPSSNRPPYFCSGCPHNTSTKLPDGSIAIGGIGCHTMAIGMNRGLIGYTHMGAEGTPWIGLSKYSKHAHIFANMGDGTYFHSGSLAIRAAVASNTNITYKILYNDAVAMTGGQPVDGEITVAKIVAQMAAEGVKKIVVVSDEPEKYPAGLFDAHGATIHDRDDLDDVQKMLRATLGCSVLIYDQTCAAEKRRRRKRGLMPDPAMRLVINEAVCEGCGDCGVASNCLSVEPVETEWGTKRRINQLSCNKDYSCVNGFCPSFVSVVGGKWKRSVAKAATEIDDKTNTPSIVVPALSQFDGGVFCLLVAGVGGTGVVTVGALLAMAAHVEGKYSSALDVTGLAQKGGAVYSHLQIAQAAGNITASRLASGSADVVLGYDLVVASSQDAVSRMQRGKTHATLNDDAPPTADFLFTKNWKPSLAPMRQSIHESCGENGTTYVPATKLAAALFGDAIYANTMLLGYLWQQAKIPLALASIVRAIELNGVSVKSNLRAFHWGRYAAHQPQVMAEVLRKTSRLNLGEAKVESVAQLIARCESFVNAYQNSAYATTFRASVEKVYQRELQLWGQSRDSDDMPLTKAYALNLKKLMCYKDEYEVARLFVDIGFKQQINDLVEGDYQIRYHMAPPIFVKRASNGVVQKREFGAWMYSAMGLLARCKFLRGSAMDIFSYSDERQHERRLIVAYEQAIQSRLTRLTTDNFVALLSIASLPDVVRGYGHVKANNMTQYAARLAQQLAEFDATSLVGQTSNKVIKLHAINA